jgi:pilus assembly protein CpaB
MASLVALKGKVLSADVGPNGQLKTSSFVDRSSLQVSAGGVDVPADRLQISFSLEPQRVLGGSLRAGDLVAVVWSSATGQSGPQTHIIVQKALVANVQLSNLANAGDSSSGSTTENPAVVGNYTVTLGLSAPDIERLTNGLEFGTIWLAKQPATASGEGTKVWDPTLVASDPVTAYQTQTVAK